MFCISEWFFQFSGLKHCFFSASACSLRSIESFLILEFVWKSYFFLLLIWSYLVLHTTYGKKCAQAHRCTTFSNAVRSVKQGSALCVYGRIADVAIIINVINKCLTVSDPSACFDEHPLCKDWVSKGDCVKKPKYMGRMCRKSCQLCHTGMKHRAMPHLLLTKVN